MTLSKYVLMRVRVALSFRSKMNDSNPRWICSLIACAVVIDPHLSLYVNFVISDGFRHFACTATNPEAAKPCTTSLGRPGGSIVYGVINFVNPKMDVSAINCRARP